jgi:hypothetical protein
MQAYHGSGSSSNQNGHPSPSRTVPASAGAAQPASCIRMCGQRQLREKAGALGHGAMRPSGHRGIGTAVVNLCVALPCALLRPSRQVFFDRSTSVHTAQQRRVCEGRQEGLQSLLIRECGGSTTAGQPETVYEEVWQQRGSWVHAFTASPHHRITAARIGKPSKHALLCSALCSLCARSVPVVCVAPAAPTLASGFRQDSRTSLA